MIRKHPISSNSLLSIFFYSFICITLPTGSAIAESLKEICEKLPECISDDRPDDGLEQAASYALGVKFHREVASEFTDIQYDLFLRGINDAKNSLVTQSSSALKSTLESVIMSKSDQSKMFLRKFVASSDALSIRGIYAKKDASTDGVELPPCVSSENNTSVYTIAFVRLQLDDPSQQNEWNTTDTRAGCIDVSESEVIRGWRTALSEMENGQVWEVVIPPELGYGSAGLKSPDGNTMLVDADVALRFILKVVNKPSSTLTEKLVQTLVKK